MSEFLFGAGDLIAHLKKNSIFRLDRLPETAIMCLSPSVALQLAKKRAWHVESSMGAKWALVPDAKLVVVSGFGIGAPASVAKIEEMKQLGVKKVFFIGTAGALQKDLKVGEVVLAESAISAEGTSKHYSTDEIFLGNEEMLHATKDLLKSKDLRPRVGKVWSTDAPYRERRSHLEKLQSQGVLAVDMEASAMYAAAKALGIEALGVFIISDHLANGVWKPEFGNAEMREQFLKVAGYLAQANR